ncbi:hypothetical protein [Oryza sativa Japonica Group]|jgi:hypothetical protein|uniref:Os01g0246300 protein n=3 Tax=Oryza TaxID=4527 RepID=A0A9K3Y7L0_ORYSJ|nr:hypothetical protein [Oryza sativa Japonica Group]BAB40068.1 hypothetical protein [Oryza sativa Japonica Group]BAF04487.2 Os01g0246300 [Oryza sativa Japonica Group]BAS71312.1 Os01g0246300 [Oryza sativa Japonica Group]|eukprot:NP_001042573.2 Os01g0246300 [Oryza sativa Japonica Group]
MDTKQPRIDAIGLRFKTVVHITLVASMAYAAFGAAVAYPASGAPAALALAFVLGYGALLFRLPFSVYALEFLRQEFPIARTPLSVQACVAVTPVALSVAVLAVLNQARAGGGGDVALATCVVWAADVAAVLSLAWCLTHGGALAMALTRRKQYEESGKALERMMKGYNPKDPAAVLFALDLGEIRDASVRLAAAVSAACAVAGGVAVGGGGGGMSYTGLSYAAAFFALPMLCLSYFQKTCAYPVDMPKHLAAYDRPHLKVIRYACVRFVAAVSAASAIAGGLVVGGVSWIGLSYAAVFFALPMCLLYFREKYGFSMSDMPSLLKWCNVSVPMAALALLFRLVTAARQAAAPDVRLVAIAGTVWAVDAAAIGFLGWRSTREMAKPILRANASEIFTSFVMVCLRYWLYLHVFYILGNGSQRWFNSL